jgi:hypothetical protein
MHRLSYLSPKAAPKESPIHGDDDDYTTDCNCGSAGCRKILTGKDWRRRDLQEKYRGYISTYLEEKIDRKV